MNDLSEKRQPLDAQNIFYWSMNCKRGLKRGKFRRIMFCLPQMALKVLNGSMYFMH